MEFIWKEYRVPDDDGELVTSHYLIDSATGRCLAVVDEPLPRRILFNADLLGEGPNRAYVTLEGAKEFCEWKVLEIESQERVEFESRIKFKRNRLAKKGEN